MKETVFRCGVLLVLIVVVGLTPVIESSNVCGRYSHYDDLLILKGDSTFSLMVNDISGSGVWAMADSNQIILKFVPGSAPTDTSFSESDDPLADFIEGLSSSPKLPVHIDKGELSGVLHHGRIELFGFLDNCGRMVNSTLMMERDSQSDVCNIFKKGQKYTADSVIFPSVTIKFLRPAHWQSFQANLELPRYDKINGRIVMVLYTTDFDRSEERVFMKQFVEFTTPENPFAISWTDENDFGSIKPISMSGIAENAAQDHLLWNGNYYQRVYKADSFIVRGQAVDFAEMVELNRLFQSVATSGLEADLSNTNTRTPSLQNGDYSRRYRQIWFEKDMIVLNADSTFEVKFGPQTYNGKWHRADNELTLTEQSGLICHLWRDCNNELFEVKCSDVTHRHFGPEVSEPPFVNEESLPHFKERNKYSRFQRYAISSSLSEKGYDASKMYNNIPGAMLVHTDSIGYVSKRLAISKDTIMLELPLSADADAEVALTDDRVIRIVYPIVAHSRYEFEVKVGEVVISTEHMVIPDEYSLIYGPRKNGTGKEALYATPSGKIIRLTDYGGLSVSFIGWFPEGYDVINHIFDSLQLKTGNSALEEIASVVNE